MPCSNIIFEKIADRYDLANRVISFGLDRYFRQYLLGRLPSHPFHLLDLATGTGEQIRSLFEKGAAIERAVGVDLSKAMLEIAQKKCFSLPVSFQIANAEMLPFKDDTFDVCTMSFGLRNISHPLAALSEMLRVAKPGGRCLILEFSVPQNLFRKPYLIYLRHILPVSGGSIAHDRPAYRYLARSIEQFASPETVLRWIEPAAGRTFRHFLSVLVR